MTAKAADMNRRKEIIDICLKTFIEDGLLRTSARDLGNAVNINSSGLYYYFKSKDEIVIACAEEAALRMEDALIYPVLRSLDDHGEFIDMATLEAAEMAPMMRFFTQVCTTKIYREAMQPILERLKRRHAEYAVKFAKKLNCKPEQVAPYLYSCVAVVSNYMIFGEELYFDQPLHLLTDAVNRFKEIQKQTKQQEGLMDSRQIN